MNFFEFKFTCFFFQNSFFLIIIKKSMKKSMRKELIHSTFISFQNSISKRYLSWSSFYFAIELTAATSFRKEKARNSLLLCTFHAYR